jgi:hypothetical protein
MSNAMAILSGEFNGILARRNHSPIIRAKGLIPPLASETLRRPERGNEKPAGSLGSKRGKGHPQ